MKLRIRNTLDVIKYLDQEVEGSLDQPFNEIIQILKNKLSIQTENIRYTIIQGDKFIPLNNFSRTLKDYNFQEDDSIMIEKNGMLEVDSYLVTLISYMGPPIIFTIYFILSSNLDYVKVLSTLLIYAHFFRRIYESTFIFKHGKEKMPVKDLQGVALYYWIFNGIFIGYSIFYSDYSDKCNTWDYFYNLIMTVLFFCCEYGNSTSHIYLANLKERNNGQRAIPNWGMFNYVTCAHYFWELLSWLCFALIVKKINAYLFVLYSFMSMGYFAYERHKNLNAYFGEKYPKNRTAFIPYIF